MFEINGNALQRSPRAEHARLFRSESGFFVDNQGEKEFVPMHSAFEKLPPHILKAFLKENYLRLERHEDGHYSLQPKVRGKGGGPITGAVAGCTAAVVGGGMTLLGAAGAFVTGHPFEAGLIAVAGTKATVAATIAAAEVGTLLPLP